MSKQIIITASAFGAIAVLAGAFGAHALKAVLNQAQLQTWQTAVQYNFYHVFALLFLAALTQGSNGLSYASYWLFTFGIILFSGSLYFLSCRELLGWNWLRIMGPITPIGGLLFIAGWLTLALSVLKGK